MNVFIGILPMEESSLKPREDIYCVETIELYPQIEKKLKSANDKS